MESTTAKWADKIQKLLAKAESTTPEEAEAISEKVAELMAEYEIDEAMLAAAAPAHRWDSDIEERVLTFQDAGAYWTEVRELCIQVGSAFDFKMTATRVSDGRDWSRVTWAGYKQDLDRAEFLYTSLMVQSVRAGKDFAKQDKVKRPYLDKNQRVKAKRGFFVGFAEGAASSIRKARAEAKAAAKERYDDNSMALVLVDKADALEKWYAEKHPNLSKGRSRSRKVDGAGYLGGVAAGRAADVGTGGNGIAGRRDALGR